MNRTDTNIGASSTEDIDTDLVRPSPHAGIRLDRNGGITLRPGDEVVTFVNRNPEPHRGYHVFMRALPAILAQRPQAQVVIVGGDEASYGPRPASGQSWKQVFLHEVRERLDPSRVHFVGRIPYATLVRLFQVSAAHVYLTYPFVLSWSMLDAMSAGALVVGSRTPPVEEVVEDGRNGVLRDFFDADAVVERYDLRRVCLPAWLRLLRDVAGRRAAPTAAKHFISAGAPAPVRPSFIPSATPA